MSQLAVLCAGLASALVKRGKQILLYSYSEKALFAIFKDCDDQQIKALKSDDLVLFKYDEKGVNFVVVTKTGLLIFFCLDTPKGYVFLSEDGEKKYTAIYKTMRIVLSDNQIVPYRCAIEDQYKFNVCDDPDHRDGIILVPFDIVMGSHWALVRVNRPEKGSCLVRITFHTFDFCLKDRLPTRQALISSEWEFVYTQGILDMCIRNNIVYILTHTCIAELWLQDYDPTPIIVPLPADRVSLIANTLYLQYAIEYREFIRSEIEWKMPSEQEFLIPSEWEVLLSTRPDMRAKVQTTIYYRNQKRPKLSGNFGDCITLCSDLPPDELLVSAMTNYGDLSPSATCPWKGLAVTDDVIFLNSIDGIYSLKESGWIPLLDLKNKLPIKAIALLAANKHIYIQSDENTDWLSFDKFGNVYPIPKFTDPILTIYGPHDQPVTFIASDAIKQWGPGTQISEAIDLLSY